MTGGDVIDYLIAGASAVAAGTIHLAEPKAGKRIERELVSGMSAMGVKAVDELVGSIKPW
jgi:dihydroorotate dehydrogenase (NAD+) catalytic subunit